jgi:addiction module HigA family antidote
MLNNLHAGQFLKVAYMMPLKLSAKSLSAKLGVNPATVNRLIAGHTGLSIEMAARLSKAFGNSIEQWLLIQTKWEIDNLEVDLSNVEIISKGETHE